MSGEIVLKNSNKFFECRLLLDIYKESLDQFNKIRIIILQIINLNQLEKLLIF